MSIVKKFYTPFYNKIDANADVMQKIIDGGTAKYPKSAAKIKFMVQQFEEDGFTSYWL